MTNKYENRILIKIAEDIGNLKASHNESSNGIKCIIDKLDSLNGRVRVTEQKVVKNETKIKNIQWIMGLVAGGISAMVAGIFHFLGFTKFK